mgnify:CR=1 FL=1
MNKDLFAERKLQEMIDLQRKKLLTLSREILPDLTPEDLRNPQDFPELNKDPHLITKMAFSLAILPCKLLCDPVYERDPVESCFADRIFEEPCSSANLYLGPEK